MVGIVQTEVNAPPRRVIKNNNIYRSVEIPNNKNPYKYKKVSTLSNLKDPTKTFSKDHKLNKATVKGGKFEILSPNIIEKKCSTQNTNPIANKLMILPTNVKQSNSKIASTYNSSLKLKKDKFSFKKNHQ